jgi:hypothetical protein
MQVQVGARLVFRTDFSCGANGGIDVLDLGLAQVGAATADRREDRRQRGQNLQLPIHRALLLGRRAITDTA